jgi:hypothetical protein
MTMPTRKRKRAHPAKRIASRNRKKPARKSPSSPSVLILECDPALLASQEITLARDLSEIVARIVPDVSAPLVSATSRQELLLRLGECTERHREFGLVVVVGHASQHGIHLTAEHDANWNEFASWLSPFRPKRIVLVACEAARWIPSGALFAGIPTLQEIYGSPVVTTQQQAAYVKLLVPYLLSGGRLPKDILPMQAANFLLSRGIVFRQTRAEFRRSGIVEGVMWTGIEEAIKTLVATRL